MLINLWDFNFRQSACSTAFQQSDHIDYVRGLGTYDGITIFTDGYLFDGSVDRVTSPVKIGWLREPRCLWPKHYELAPGVVEKFDFILTYCSQLLKLPGFKFVPYGGIWVNRESWQVHPKTKLISMLYGDKLSTEGHRLRHAIANTLGNKYGIDYYGFQGQPTDYSAETKLKVHRDYMFSIVIETCREDNLFTEILLDCFAVGTVPIFWGAPNIHKFFNWGGVISFPTIEGIWMIMDLITPQYYQALWRVIPQNYQQAKQYAVTEDWMYHNDVFEGLL